MDDKILENVAGYRGGSTAVTAILIGDSRAINILCRDRGNAAIKQVTTDHEPQKEKEQGRICRL